MNLSRYDARVRRWLNRFQVGQLVLTKMGSESWHQVVDWWNLVLEVWNGGHNDTSQGTLDVAGQG
jgi:hypothetical protein